MQIPDRDDFSSPLCSVRASTADPSTFSCSSVQAGKMFICPVSQNAANLGRNLAQLFFLSLVFLIGFQTPSSCWTARSNLKVKKLALHIFFSPPLHLPPLPASRPRLFLASLHHSPKLSSCLHCSTVDNRADPSHGVYICTEMSENIQARRRPTLR